MFLVRMKSASVPKTWLWIKATASWGCLYTRSPIVCGCAFHPRAIGDPRGRGAVRASSSAAARVMDLQLLQHGLGVGDFEFARTLDVQLLDHAVVHEHGNAVHAHAHARSEEHT